MEALFFHHGGISRGLGAQLGLAGDLIGGLAGLFGRLACGLAGLFDRLFDGLAGLFADERFDLVLLDITMPRMGGIEALGLIHASAARAGTPPVRRRRRPGSSKR